MNTLYVLLLIFVSVNSEITKTSILEKLLSIKETTKEVFKIYHFLYEKKYDLNTEEGLKRYKTFKANLKVINEINSQKLTYRVGINEFADWTREEYLSILIPADLVKKQERHLYTNFMDFDSYKDEDEVKLISAPVTNPSFGPYKQMPQVDWRKNFVPAKGQMNCGSCWAFSAVGTIEAAYNIKNGGQPVALSEQQLVDCDTQLYGCRGGFSNLAFKWIQQYGLMTDQDYPYTSGQTGQQGYCRYNQNAQMVKVTGYDYCTNYYLWEDQSKTCTPDALYALISRGPLAVLIDASSQNLAYYQGGMFQVNAYYCTQRNHAVILAGMGVDPQTQQAYALVRNSWGAQWGEQGYIRIAYDPNDQTNTCFTTGAGFLPFV